MDLFNKGGKSMERTLDSEQFLKDGLLSYVGSVEARVQDPSRTTFNVHPVGTASMLI
jgi:hypothetical protein